MRHATDSFDAIASTGAGPAPESFVSIRSRLLIFQAMTLAEIPYPVIDPILFQVGWLKVRWYGVSYLMAFVLAYFVLRGLSRRGRWPVPAERVADVLFWGIVGVFLGGRIGYEIFYAVPQGTFEWGKIFHVWEGGMSFHGGLLGVILAYWIYTGKKKLPRGDFFDGLSLATAPGIFCVRLANFVNAELYGREWDGPWAMRFPVYPDQHPELWDGRTFTRLRHPSQLYEAFAEGLLLFLILRWLMLGRGLGGGRISGWFLVLYGTFRFVIEFFRTPDRDQFALFDFFTSGQLLCFGMIVAGVVVLARAAPRAPRPAEPSAVAA
jgi:phosphatidylglycerol:prolipoprotein diacylglycerol transferase